MNLQPCPLCGSEVLQFLGNESGTGKSWFACRACPLTRQVFSLKLAESPRFDFADTITRRKAEPDDEGAAMEQA